MPSPSLNTHLVFCLISDERVFAAKSPAVFNRVMPIAGIKATYVPFHVAARSLGEALRGLKALNIAGANITVPYKETVIPYMDALSESANIIGAVNTLAFSGDQIKGYNTNAIGIMDALEEADFQPAGKNVLILGAGGAAKAVAFVLKWLKAENIFIVGRNAGKTRALAARVGGTPLTFNDLADHAPLMHLIVNATTVSTNAESPEMAQTAKNLVLSNCELIYDLNYGRAVNIWQILAQERGVSFMDGLSTLSHQARNSLFLWTGLEVSPEHFKNALSS